MLHFPSYNCLRPNVVAINADAMMVVCIESHTSNSTACAFPETGSLQTIADLWLKAHVKHPVSFVKNQVSDSLHVARLHLDQVNHPAWCTYCDLKQTRPPSITAHESSIYTG